ncbi:MAG: beta galactosidase jelly roll domain-containing protein [Candidatus Delongbacteria bacterium]|nr:beta galactosidase jelly roll domain-containing protein [Candidatus Delongbacteria bacterium]
MKKHLILIIILMTAVTFSQAENRKEINLGGEWKFRIGDRPEYAQPAYSDQSWKRIRVPSDWENQGYPGYDGYAWYRIQVRIPSNLKTRELELMMGRIDDVDQVFLNGDYIGGKGNFPPGYSTAYNEWREYPIPPDFIRWDQDNLIAVRVFDEGLNGGIIEGQPGIYSVDPSGSPALNLSGLWKFRTGDSPQYAKPTYNDIGWNELLVPAMWDSQGYRDYDGWAWYRKTFRIPTHLADEELVLVVGMIDDMDQTFFNGEMIGHTGNFTPEEMTMMQNNYWNQLRYYYIPPHLIRKNGPNTIAVRVYDVWKDGGIYHGPVGIMTQQHYMELQKKNPPQSLWKSILDGLLKNEN